MILVHVAQEKNIKSVTENSMIKKVVTHNGTFHADDVFAIATLSLTFANEMEVCRSRDAVTIATADMAVDVGGIYDEMKDRFDHHQEKGAGKRKNGIPYASFGLVWKKYGLTLCGNQTIVDKIDKEIVAPIDAEDNGIEIVRSIKYKLHQFSVSSMIHVFNATWKEDVLKQDEVFIECVNLAKKILSRLITKERDRLEAERFVQTAYEEAEDKRLIILDNNYPSREVLANYPEPLYVIRPYNGKWNVEAQREEIHSFKNKKDFPKSWGGKTDKELQKITGVSDAVFCHRNLFLAVASSKEGAIELAKKALNN